jgi:hypothetical protein
MSSPTEPDIALEGAHTALREVYRERAHLVALLASMYPSHGGKFDQECPEWLVVIIELPTGQVSWHISPDDEYLFEHVRRTWNNNWDGHTTALKYARVDAYTRANAEGRGEVV